MPTAWRFPILIAVSFLAFIYVLRFCVRRRDTPPANLAVVAVAAVVVVGGMVFAKLGATLNLPVWIYYGIPASLTWLFPPLAFRMSAREVARYLPLAVLLAPLIHGTFALLLGWKEYMPFLPIPSLAELLG